MVSAPAGVIAEKPSDESPNEPSAVPPAFEIITLGSFAHMRFFVASYQPVEPDVVYAPPPTVLHVSREAASLCVARLVVHTDVKMPLSVQAPALLLGTS